MTLVSFLSYQSRVTLAPRFVYNGDKGQFLRELPKDFPCATTGGLEGRLDELEFIKRGLDESPLSFNPLVREK